MFPNLLKRKIRRSALFAPRWPIRPPSPTRTPVESFSRADAVGALHRPNSLTPLGAVAAPTPSALPFYGIESFYRSLSAIRTGSSDVLTYKLLSFNRSDINRAVFFRPHALTGSPCSAYGRLQNIMRALVYSGRYAPTHGVGKTL